MVTAGIPNLPYNIQVVHLFTEHPLYITYYGFTHGVWFPVKQGFFSSPLLTCLLSDPTNHLYIVYNGLRPEVKCDLST